ncbi:hypothetical protein AAL_05607 [Moelleriella libera RCEF 2490]|uniref:Uncharacterized protein n=1 Tax=Moelleriella libera RCEF 2490 TaxID=1081109 RepID=A0A167ZXM4_9HYPO|nr:hypothetical protein AAL_05607 [Moelleriella libera RCEF 2490]
MSATSRARAPMPLLLIPRKPGVVMCRAPRLSAAAREPRLRLAALLRHSSRPQQAVRKWCFPTASTTTSRATKSTPTCLLDSDASSSQSRQSLARRKQNRQGGTGDGNVAAYWLTRWTQVSRAGRQALEAGGFEAALLVVGGGGGGGDGRASSVPGGTLASCSVSDAA